MLILDSLTTYAGTGEFRDILSVSYDTIVVVIVWIVNRCVVELRGIVSCDNV